MIDCKIFLMIEQLCKRFTTKDGRYKPWGGRHVILFGDTAQLPPVSNTDIFNTIPWVNFNILQLKEVVRAKDATLSSILLKIRDGICDDQVASVLQSCIKSVDVKSVDLTRTAIICSRRNEVETINNECLKLIDGEEYQFEAKDTYSNGQTLRETDQKRLQHINT